MWRRQWLFGALPVALTLGACSDNPAAPGPEVSDRANPSFHVVSKTCDFVTAGGFVVIDGEKITFGLHGGRSREGTVFGHLTVVNHGSRTRYQSTRITKYGTPIAPFFVSIPAGGVTRLFEGQL